MMAVSVARSLGRAGVPFIALGDRYWDAVASSRYCREFVHVGGGEGVGARWHEWLVRERRGGVVLTGNDDSLEFLASRRSELQELGYSPLEANDEIVLAMLDKERTYQLAAQVGIPAPRTATVDDRESLERAVDELGLPVALKPLHAHLFARRFGLLKKVIVIDERAQLEEAFASTVGAGMRMLVTEIIPGGDDQYWSYYSYLDERGEPLFHFTKRKLRQFPPRFGLACYQVTEWSPETAELGLRFFQGVGLRGIGNVEFKRDPRDGQLKLIECNHRFTAANELVRAAGIDIALLAYERALGRPGPTFATFRSGLHMWHPVEDVRGLRGRRAAGDLTLGRWAASLLHVQHFPLLSLRDPAPAVSTYGRMLRRLGARVRRRRPAHAAFEP